MFDPFTAILSLAKDLLFCVLFCYIKLKLIFFYIKSALK